MNPVHASFCVSLRFVLIYSSVVLRVLQLFLPSRCVWYNCICISHAITRVTWPACLRRNSPKSGLGCLVVEVSRSRAQTRETPGRTLLNEGSAQRRGPYPHNTQQTQQTSIFAPPPNGVRTCDPRNRAAADIRLRPHGRRDLLPAIFSSGNPYSFQRNVKVVKLLTQFSSTFRHFRPPILDQ